MSKISSEKATVWDAARLHPETKTMTGDTAMIAHEIREDIL